MSVIAARARPGIDPDRDALGEDLPPPRPAIVNSPPGFVRREDFSYALREDGGRIEREA